MVFSSPLFLFFYLPAVLLVYYMTPLRWRNAVLLVFNLIFYGWGEPVYILIMFLSIAIDYTHGMLVEKAKRRGRDGRARAAVCSSVLFNLALLFFFKYWDFLAESLAAVGLDFMPRLGLSLPIGISFYTFQTMTYPVDVYRGDAQVQRSGGVNQKTLLRRAQGFTEEELSAEGRSNPAVTMAPPVTDNYKSLFDGDVITCGGYRLRCIQVPGHTPGQMCYWLEEEGAMLLGDHVLFDITPNITNWEGVDDSLGNYLDSLRAIRAYDVALPLPGHRGRGAFRARIDDLLAHHEHRLAEALEVVKKYPGNTAYFLAGHMTWKIRANSWEEFPLAQKWFAVGECASHMDYLKRRDLIREEPDGEGLLRYYPC